MFVVCKTFAKFACINQIIAMFADYITKIRARIVNLISEGMGKIRTFFRVGTRVPKPQTCLPFIIFRKFFTDLIDVDLANLYKNSKRGRKNCNIKRLMAMVFYLYGKSERVRTFVKDIESNPLLRYALGYEPNEKPYCIATMYNFMGRIARISITEKRNPFSEVFSKVVEKLVSFFELKCEALRTDSKQFASNIAYDNRYVIVILVLQYLCRIEEINPKTLMDKECAKKIHDILDSTPRQDCYHNAAEVINAKMLEAGEVMSCLIKELGDSAPSMLVRVFNDQFFYDAENKVAARRGDEIKGTSLQSPFDPDCECAEKYDLVKGYVINLAENISEAISLVTSVIVEGACTPDIQFTKPCISDTETCSGRNIKDFYADGAYNDASVREWLKDRGCRYVFTGFKGKPSKYLIEECDSGEYKVTNTETGTAQFAHVTKGGTIRIDNEGKGTCKYRYFTQKMLEVAKARISQGLITKEERNKRNNVEGTIAQFSSALDGDKCRYRGMFACRRFGICRAMFMNINRICIFIEENFKDSLRVIAA